MLEEIAHPGPIATTGNAEHYDLERRLTDKIWTADDTELRTAVVSFVKDASVGTVNELAVRLGVPRT